MRRIVLALGVVVLAACAKKEPEPEVVVEVPAPAPAPAPVVDLAMVAGTWDMQVMGATSDSVLTTYTLNATSTTEGWMMMLPKRPPLALRVTVSGDSIMSEAPEYESVLRKGVKVRTMSVFHVNGSSMTGTTTAHYTINGADSVVMLRSSGTRKPM